MRPVFWVVLIARFHCKDPNLAPYFKRRTELSTDQGCILWGQRVIIPDKYKEVNLEELHDCHPGIVKMKALCRSYVWWPDVDKDIEKKVRQCDACQVQGGKVPSSPMYPWEWPTVPWKRLHLDYAGPVEGMMILVIIDASSKFIEAHVIKKATAANTVAKLRQTFSTHGLPQVIVSDNGTPFKNELFSEFCELNGIQQVFVSPYHPSSNGLAERCVQTIKSGIKKAKGSKDDLESQRQYRFLLHYNKIPQGTTGVAPCELLMKRTLRSRIDVVKPNLKNKVENNQLEMKTRKDTIAAHRSFYAGDQIYARNFIGTTKWLPGVIEKVLAPLTFRIKLKDGHIWRRHQDHIKLRYTDETDTEGNETAIQDSKFQSVPQPVPPQVSGVNSKETGIMDSTVDTRTADHSTSVPSVEQIPKSPIVVESPRIKPVRRSEHIIKKPEKLNLNIKDGFN